MQIKFILYFIFYVFSLSLFLNPIDAARIDAHRGSDPSSPDSNVKYDLNVTISPKEVFRGSNVSINTNVSNNEKNRDLEISYVKLAMNPEICRKDIFIKNKKLIRNRNLLITSNISIGKTLEVGEYDIIFPEDCEIDFQHCIANEDNHHISTKLTILNNQPIITNSTVTIEDESKFCPQNNKTLIFIGDSSDHHSYILNILATDVEDISDLQFSGGILPESPIIPIESLSEWHSGGVIKNIERNLTEGTKYNFYARVKDSDGAVNATKSKIIYKNNCYDELYVPGISYFEKVIAIFAIILSIIVPIVLIRRLGARPFFTRNNAVALILCSVIGYIILYYKNSVSLYDIFIFLNAVPLFAFLIYIIAFILVGYLIESCFSLDDETIPQKALFLNFISMATVFILFIYVLPHVNYVPITMLTYYGTLSGLLGVLLVLMVTLSGNFPKNIITIDARISGVESRKLFSYPKKLEIFIIFFGLYMTLSLFGLITGADLRFSFLIYEPFGRNAINLLSLALFEFTLLLVPQIIIGLYHLLQIIYFRGKITIESKPSGANIRLSKRYEPGCLINPKIEASRITRLIQYVLNGASPQRIPSDPDLYDLELNTPCSLMLMSGEYKIRLEKTDWENDWELEQRILVRAGVEETRSMNLVSVFKKLP